ncbi:MAG TPA: Lrp/AsnC family transcriptional regulator, partial [Candidatus Nitrosopelagicus sp.]|nr:Lrp/AsnC family transcriptional regulator [Candidatus Nitrosopelagicus sp.]
MDKLDTEILNEIQWEFPLVIKPFDEIAKKFGI